MMNKIQKLVECISNDEYGKAKELFHTIVSEHRDSFNNEYLMEEDVNLQRVDAPVTSEPEYINTDPTYNNYSGARHVQSVRVIQADNSGHVLGDGDLEPSQEELHDRVTAMKPSIKKPAIDPFNAPDPEVHEDSPYDIAQPVDTFTNKENEDDGIGASMVQHNEPPITDKTDADGDGDLDDTTGLPDNAGESPSLLKGEMDNDGTNNNTDSSTISSSETGDGSGTEVETQTLEPAPNNQDAQPAQISIPDLANLGTQIQAAGQSVLVTPVNIVGG